jgi:glutathione reductase (NADPH)
MKYLFNQEKPKILMKLIVDTKTDKVLGIHMLGQDSPEIIQSLSVALTAGATKKDFDNTTAIHPTSAEEFVTMRK